MGAGGSMTNFPTPPFRLATAVVLAAALSGCTLFHDRGAAAPRARTAVSGNIDIGRIAEEVNANSRAIRSVACDRVTISGRAKNPNGGTDPFTVDAKLAFQAPNNLRMRGSFAARPEIDLGSNGEEIWFWARRADPNKLLVCDRRELSRVDLAIPFHPDTLAEILGVVSIDPARWEPVGEKGDLYFIKSMQATPDGRPALKVLTFRRSAVRGKPDRLAGISLRDVQQPKVVLANAVIEEWYDDPRSGISVPRAVRLEWPEQETNLHMLLQRGAVEVNTIDAEYAAQLFSRADISKRLEVIDMARVGRKAPPPGEPLRTASGGLSDAPASDPRRGPRRLRADLDR